MPVNGQDEHEDQIAIPTWTEVLRREADGAETARANRAWWDAEAEGYHAEHGDFLGDDGFVWGPEGWTEEELGLLGDVTGRDVLEIGAGGGQCSRWLAGQGARVVATDLSSGMLRTARQLNAGADSAHRPTAPLAQCDATALPFADASFDVVFTAYGAVPFVADLAGLLGEAARVLRPGGRLAYSTTHPLRWSLPDDPGPDGLVVRQAYFDRTPYVESDIGGEASYVEHHRTVGDHVRMVVGSGLTLLDLFEPEWPARNVQTWGGWSPLRGELVPGTLIVVAALVAS